MKTGPPILKSDHNNKIKDCRTTTEGPKMGRINLLYKSKPDKSKSKGTGNRIVRWAIELTPSAKPTGMRGMRTDCRAIINYAERIYPQGSNSSRHWSRTSSREQRGPRTRPWSSTKPSSCSAWIDILPLYSFAHSWNNQKYHASVHQSSLSSSALGNIFADFNFVSKLFSSSSSSSSFYKAVGFFRTFMIDYFYAFVDIVFSTLEAE